MTPDIAIRLRKIKGTWLDILRRWRKADTNAKPLTVQGLRNRKSLWPDEVPPMPADLLPDEKWHHVTFTRDEEGKEAWYVGGKLVKDA